MTHEFLRKNFFSAAKPHELSGSKNRFEFFVILHFKIAFALFLRVYHRRRCLNLCVGGCLVYGYSLFELACFGVDYLQTVIQFVINRKKLTLLLFCKLERLNKYLVIIISDFRQKTVAIDIFGAGSLRKYTERCHRNQNGS